MMIIFDANFDAINYIMTPQITLKYHNTLSHNHGFSMVTAF
jgi:hypothetical protein